MDGVLILECILTCQYKDHMHVEFRMLHEITCLGIMLPVAHVGKKTKAIQINEAASHLASIHEDALKKTECDIPNMLGYSQQCRALERECDAGRWGSLAF